MSFVAAAAHSWSSAVYANAIVAQLLLVVAGWWLVTGQRTTTDGNKSDRHEQGYDHWSATKK